MTLGTLEPVAARPDPMCCHHWFVPRDRSARPSLDAFYGDIAEGIGEVDGVAALAGPKGASFTMLDLVGLPDDEADLARLVLRARRRPTVESAATDLGWTTDVVDDVLGRLVERGALSVVDGEIRTAEWRVQRKTPDGLWDVLGDL